ncbi:MULTISPECIES: DUF72 domain-containing protein [Legionella]|nr:MULTISPECIES: DUF72 domain-containing protein [Legionella]MCP0914539.1 DUF72 domain-containing protein [Legionella sp. 27cVA30]
MEDHFQIGTSGWSFNSWKGQFYPKDLKAKEWLPFYAQYFTSVELNNSFYQLPKLNSVKTWCESTPQDFIFSLKAHRYITHMKRLNDSKESLDKMLEIFAAFDAKLGPILFQFPPSFSLDLSRLQDFLKHLSREYRYTFEFRNKSWFCAAVYALLEKQHISLCFYDYKNYQAPEILTSDLVYIRLHGPQQQPYHGSYSRTMLTDYAEKLISWRKQNRHIFCYFDNDEKACAPKNALYLKEQLTRKQQDLLYLKNMDNGVSHEQ